MRDIHKTDLDKRHASEERFHDNKYSEHAHYPYHYKFNPTYFVFQEMKSMIGDLHNKKILEYGCGEGWTTAELVAMGGTIDSFDISSIAIEHAKKYLTQRDMIQRCRIKKMAAEKLEYADESFDLVTGFAILHHLNLDKALPELYRVMKNGGKAFFAEPLGTNPIIKLYRILTPQYRTADEEPIILSQFNKNIKEFSKYTHREYYLTALLPLGLSYLHLPASVIFRLNSICHVLDKKILNKFNFLGKFAWYTIIRLDK